MTFLAVRWSQSKYKLNFVQKNYKIAIWMTSDYVSQNKVALLLMIDLVFWSSLN